MKFRNGLNSAGLPGYHSNCIISSDHVAASKQKTLESAAVSKSPTPDTSELNKTQALSGTGETCMQTYGLVTEAGLSPSERTFLKRFFVIGTSVVVSMNSQSLFPSSVSRTSPGGCWQQSTCFHWAVCCLKIQRRPGRGMLPVVSHSKKFFKKSSELQLIIITYSPKPKGNGSISWRRGWSGTQQRSG